MSSNCCSSSDFLQSHYTVLLSRSTPTSTAVLLFMWRQVHLQRLLAAVQLSLQPLLFSGVRSVMSAFMTLTLAIRDWKDLKRFPNNELGTSAASSQVPESGSLAFCSPVGVGWGWGWGVVGGIKCCLQLWVIHCLIMDQKQWTINAILRVDCRTSQRVASSTAMAAAAAVNTSDLVGSWARTDSSLV